MEHEKPAQPGRVSLATTCGLTMFACAAGYGAYSVLVGTKHPSLYIGIVLSIPIIATAFFILIAQVLVPSLLAPKKLVFPLNFTLPPVYMALVVLTALLVTSTGNNLIAPFERANAALFWVQPKVLLLVIGSQIVCLTALAKLKNESVD